MSFSPITARPPVVTRRRLTAFSWPGTLVAGVAIPAIILASASSGGAEQRAPETTAKRDPLVTTQAAYDRAVAEGEGPAKALAEVRRTMAETYRQLTAENRSLQLQQAELERKDPIANGLREKLVALEKEMKQVRASLRARLDAIEEIREIEEKRQVLIRQVELLKKEERALLNVVAKE